MKSTPNSTTSVQLDAGVELIRSVVGTALNTERIKLFILGAHGDVEIALNHALNFIEKSKRPQNNTDTTSALQKLLEELAEEVKCSICLGYLSEPVALSCIHTFCLDCIKSSESSNCIVCPLCRKATPLGFQGVECLKQHDSLANIIGKLRSVQATKLCGECHNVVSSTYCVECKQYYCEDCCRTSHAGAKTKHQCKAFEDCYMKDNVLMYLKDSPIHRNSVSTNLGWNPEYAISFKIKRNDCLDIFNQWIEGLWFAPFGLESRITLAPVEAVYLPYWQYMLPEDSLDRPTYVPSKSVVLLATEEYDSLLTPVDLWEEEALVPLTVMHTNQCKVARIDKSAKFTWNKDSTVDSRYQSWDVNTLRTRVIFIPVYISSYVYKGNKYSFMINGSSGRCMGHRPYSYTKLSLAGGLGAAISLLTTARITN